MAYVANTVQDYAKALPAGNLIDNGKNLDLARETVAEVFVDHRLTPQRSALTRPINIHCARASTVAVCYFDYGRTIEISPEIFESFYLLAIPISGAFQVTCGTAIAECGQGSSIVLPASKEISMAWSHEARNLVLQIDCKKLTSKLEAYLGRPLLRAPEFELSAQSLEKVGKPLQAALHGVLALAAPNSAIRGTELICASFEDALISSILHDLPSDLSRAIHDGTLSSACPRSVRRAEQYIEAHLAEPIRVEKLAEVAGTSSRALFEAFKRFRDTTPMRFVRVRRLHTIRDRIIAGESDVPLQTLAAQWGFSHPGRFSAEYAKLFGELPSDTMRRSRH